MSSHQVQVFLNHANEDKPLVRRLYQTLKAIAWLDLNARKEQGAKVDAKDVRKHLNDVLRLSQLLAPATRIPLVQKIGDDMTRFLSAVASDTSIDPKSLQLGNITVAELVDRIAQAYELNLPKQGGV